MPTIQEMLTAIRTQMAEAPSQELLMPVVEAVRSQEKLLVAFFTPTRHYFMTMERDIPTAVLFSNQDSFERFAERCKEQGLFTAAIENPLESRKVLFMDLYRCGFRQIMIDYAPQFLVLPMTAFMPVPDDSALPVAKRSFLNKKLNGYILWLLQQIHSRRASGLTELQMLRELYHSALLLPSEQFDAGGKTAFHIPNVVQDGKRLCYLYSDFQEWSRSGDPKFPPIAARYPQLMELLAGGIDRLVINPGGGAELTLDRTLLETAEKAAMGTAEGIGNAFMNEQDNITVSDPTDAPQELYAALTSLLTEQKDIRAAYLRVLKRDTILRPSYLLLLDGKSSASLRTALNKAAQPFLGTNDFEITTCREAPFWVGKAKPFFKSGKKRK